MLRRLASLKLAAWLMIASIALLVLAVVIPQRDFLGPVFDEFVADYPGLASVVSALALDRLFRGWAIWLVATVLCVNVIVCTLTRLSKGRPRMSLSGMKWTPINKTQNADRVLRLATTAVDNAGFTSVTSAKVLLAAERGTSGFWGSIMLHLSILVIALGGIASAFLSFSGEMVIAEGQSLLDVRESYLSVSEEPRFGSAYSGSTIAVDAVDFAYEDHILVKAEASMRAIDDSGKVITRDVSVNHPLDVAGKSFLLMDSGLAAELLMPGGGQDVRGNIVNLGDKTRVGWQDRIELAGPSGELIALELIAMPVKVESGGEMPPEQLLIREPHLFLRALNGSETYAERLLAPGDQIEIAPGQTITFSGLRVWNRYLVRGDQGRWVTYIGFWIAVAGIVWRFAVPHRVVAIRERRDGAGLEVGFRSYPWAGLSVRVDDDMIARIASAESTAVEPDDAE